MAQAYETWWSPSQAAQCKPGQEPGCDLYADARKYHEGAARAREKAMTYYGRVLGLAPEGLEAAYARHHLPRLKLGIDTNQRRFFCVYD